MARGSEMNEYKCPECDEVMPPESGYYRCSKCGWPMTVERAVDELRLYFREKAQHEDGCICDCCRAVEVLAMAANTEAQG